MSVNIWNIYNALQTQVLRKKNNCFFRTLSPDTQITDIHLNVIFTVMIILLSILYSLQVMVIMKDSFYLFSLQSNNDKVKSTIQDWILEMAVSISLFFCSRHLSL